MKRAVCLVWALLAACSSGSSTSEEKQVAGNEAEQFAPAPDENSPPPAAPMGNLLEPIKLRIVDPSELDGAILVKCVGSYRYDDYDLQDPTNNSTSEQAIERVYGIDDRRQKIFTYSEDDRGFAEFCPKCDEMRFSENRIAWLDGGHSVPDKNGLSSVDTAVGEINRRAGTANDQWDATQYRDGEAIRRSKDNWTFRSCVPTNLQEVLSAKQKF